ncbi:uncharacterized protein LOC123988371 [Osmia bicornis bicornis]|uniref:uncharacterized protein LOC123988371 n=1 Tax=Osmia bicornis bicornis TaxID=1437191 RepID=UPI001EAE9610|nr:uncharacterized protein LOC123988371 [Osmia bicornis bicornis]
MHRRRSEEEGRTGGGVAGSFQCFWIDPARHYPRVAHQRRGAADDDKYRRQYVYRLRDEGPSPLRGTQIGIPILSGVKQGCPLSPILFNLALEPVIRVAEDSTIGYKIAGERIVELAYADDIALLAECEEEMRRLLREIESIAANLGLAFNAKKCATLHIRGRDDVLDTVYRIQEEPVPALEKGESYQHLGIPTGVQLDQTPYTTIRGVLEDLGALDRSLLAPWQKIEALATFIVPRLDFLLRGANIRRMTLSELDKAIKRTVKLWLHLPQRASPEVVHIPPSLGGCGLPPIADLAEVTAVAHAFRLLNAKDTVVARIARFTLEAAASEKLRRAPTDRDLAQYLSGSLAGDWSRPTTGRSSFWSRVRSVALRSGARLGFRWEWCDDRAELAIVMESRNGRRVVVPPLAKAHVITRMRAAVTEHYVSSLLRKPDQGKVFQATIQHAASNRFMRGGAFIRFADWRFIHRARLDVLPLNGARRWGSEDKRCRRCGYTLESLPHVLCHCGPHSAARQRRHDNLVLRLSKAIRLPGEIRINRRVPGATGESSALRPDIVVTHEASKTVVLVDVAVPFENTMQAIADARFEKINKYQQLADSLKGRGYKVYLDAFIVGALGAWDPGNEFLLELLRISPRYASLMRKLMIAETIAWSRDMYVEHVSGIRQYTVSSTENNRNNVTEDLEGEAQESSSPRMTGTPI